jgi:hypothetical protein
MAAVDDYPGPRITGRGGRGAGGWIWVEPGLPPPSPEERIDPAAPALEGSEGASPDQDGADSTSVVLMEEMPDRSSQNDESSPPDALEHDSPQARINVVGPVEIEPWLEAPTRSKVTEAACFLALHRRRPVTTEELQIALSSDGDTSETSAKSIRTYMSELRRSLGAVHLPSARGSGYRLADSVTCDWDEIKELAARRPTDPDDQIWALCQALNLVRGRPFEGTSYRWVDSELLVSEMEVAIADIARRLAKVAAAKGGVEAIVYFAGRRAVLACPYDVGLWEIALKDAAAWDPGEPARTWHDAQVTLGDDAIALHDLAQSLGLL